MPYAKVKPVVDLSVRGLCCEPYPLHPRGCPNFGKKKGCPPAAPELGEFFDLKKPTFVVWNVFPIGRHVERMWKRHPEWSERQLHCCLYWQNTARAELEDEIASFMGVQSRALWGARLVTRCPEAMGLDVTATMKSLGIVLEWPPRELAYQVAFAGTVLDVHGETKKEG